MSDHAVRKLVFSGPGCVSLASEPSRPLSPTEARIRTLCSGISRGTEMSIYRGDASFFRKAYDPELRLFRSSAAGAWSYPVEFGYENVGEIEEVGSEVEGYEPGDIVLTYSPHREECIVDLRRREPLLGNIDPLLPLPEGILPEHGVFVPLLGVALNAMLDAQLVLSESAVIFGAGIVGLLLVQLVRRAGAGSIFVVEPSAPRRRVALGLGADEVFDPAAGGDLAASIRSRTHGRGADVAFEASGTYRGLHEAIRTVGYNGRVVASSWLNGPGSDLCLGDEFHLNRVRLLSSQSLGINPVLSDRWDNARRTEAALQLLATLELDGLITHRFALARAQEAFDLVDRNPDQVLQVILTYGSST